MNGGGEHLSLQTARSLFEAAEFSAAAEMLFELRDQLDFESPDFQILIEILRDQGDFERAAMVVQDKIRVEFSSDRLQIAMQIHWLHMRFDLLTRADDSIKALEAGLNLLATIASTEELPAWQNAIDLDWLGDVEESTSSPRELLDVLELQALAPEMTGLPDRVAARVEEIGHANAGDSMLSRDVEVLLHALGKVDAAYRVERSRRSFATQSKSERTVASRVKPVSGLSIVIAGGHPALRSLISRALIKEGARSVTGIPSAKEASRVGRDIQAVLTGADVAVLLVRQIAHSTSNQIKSAAVRANVPVLLVESSGTAGVRRAIERWRST